MGYMDELDLRRELEYADGYVTSFAERPARRMTDREIERAVDDYERDTGRYVSLTDRDRLRRVSRSAW